jgi:hypothetical protein
MAKYRLTIELTIQLSREVEANSVELAEQFAETMYQEYKKSNTTDVIGTEQRRTVEILSHDQGTSWAPVGP